jgi:Mg-chelatase subunit ChlD
MTAATRPLHIYFVLDRSGSMQSIAPDVIGGFNSFLAAQQADGADAVMTLVQFDSQDSHEVLTDATAIRNVRPLSPRSFQPRGGTPLYDAMGHAIADAAIRAERLRGTGEAAEEIMFVTLTDGGENQSVEYSRDKIFELINRREADGWTFAYVGANQDAYAEGARIGYAPGSTQNFAADAAGSRAAFASLSGAFVQRRHKIRAGEQYDKRDLFEGDKGAEDDLRRRGQNT